MFEYLIIYFKIYEIELTVMLTRGVMSSGSGSGSGSSAAM